LFIAHRDPKIASPLLVIALNMTQIGLILSANRYSKFFLLYAYDEVKDIFPAV